MWRKTIFFIFSEFAFADKVNQTQHSFSGITKIQHYSFFTDHLFYALDNSIGRKSITRPEIISIRKESLTFKSAVNSNKFCGSLGQQEYFSFLAFFVRVHTNPQNSNTPAYSFQIKYEFGLCAGAAICNNQMINFKTAVI